MQKILYIALSVALLLGLAAVGLGLLDGDSIPTPAGMTVPEGFEVELAAGPPLVERPITIDFDESGGLYVSDSSGSNEKVEIQLEKRPHRILRLEDSDGDGRYDRRTVFADGMMFPEGTLWYDGSLYVAAPPSIWKLTDTDGDGVADQREEWFQGKTLTGCANDLHGPYLGPDGWIYWCKGGFAEQTYERPGKKPLITRAAHIYRRHPDRPYVEPVLTGGMDNPVDVDFTPEGERLLTATFYEHPRLGRRDALIHAVYGGVYGKIHGVLDDHPKTGEYMDNLTHYGPAAPCGLTRYSSSVFGEDYRNNFFAALFNLHKVTRHELSPKGATFESRDSDFLVSSDPDFHPTDVLEDADGSLLVVNTGGWYKLCCPTSQLEKPDVLGAIYRVRRRDASGPSDARGLSIAWASSEASQLADLLADPRPAVQRRATHALAKLGTEAVPVLAKALQQGQSIEARRNAVWALTRIEGPEAREAVRQALKDSEASVRHAAVHSAGVRRDEGAVATLVTLLESDSPAIQRASSEALGRIGSAQAVSALLAASEAPADRTLEHSVIFALIEIGSPEQTRAGLSAGPTSVRKAALIALDQMEGDVLAAETVVPLLTSQDQVLQDTAWWIAQQHPDWGSQLAGFFGGRLKQGGLSKEEQEKLESRMVQFTSNPAIQDLLARTAQGGGPAAQAALRVMTASGLKEMPALWVRALERALSSSDPELVGGAIATARALPVPKEETSRLSASLRSVSQNRGLGAQLRTEALAAVPGELEEVNEETFELLVSSLEASQPAALRGAAARVFEKARLRPQQLQALTSPLQQAGPMELPHLLVAFDHGRDEQLGLQMLQSLRESKAVSVLRPDLLLPRLEHYPDPVRKEGEALLASLDQDPVKQKAHLDELLAGLPEGDIRRGQQVFNGEIAGCATCHAIGYEGGKVGPDLTRIGQIRNERDLLEAVVYPSASFVRSYEPVVVTTTSGEVHSGVIREEGRDSMLLATGPVQEVRIARSDIEEIRPGTVSVMPSGLDEQLSRQQLADLLAFLKAAKRR